MNSSKESDADVFITVITAVSPSLHLHSTQAVNMTLRTTFRASARTE